MHLETGRLLIYPLSEDQLLTYIGSDYAFEKAHELNISNRVVPARMQDVIRQKLIPTLPGPGNDHRYHTIWTMVDKTMKLIVGDIYTKGWHPGKPGEIELGYGTYTEFQNRGYMTEAVMALSHWALTQEVINTVTAETRKDNIPSHRTLEKSGFRRFKETDDMIWWRLDK